MVCTGAVPRKSHGDYALRNVTSFSILREEGEPLSERHTSLCSRRRRGRYKAPITVTRRMGPPS
jgi:hypothetical protein